MHDRFAWICEVCDFRHSTYGDSPDRWWCVLIDLTNWVPSIATQCATGRIYSIPGKITAGKRLGERMVFYKDAGIALGVYEGPSGFIWSFLEVPCDFGAACQELVVDIGQAHLFASKKGFYSYDGASVTEIDIEIREWWLGRVDEKYLHLGKALHDKARTLVYWWYIPVGAGATIPSECVVYNYRTGKWGLAHRQIEAAVDFVRAGLTWDELGSVYPTWDDLPAIPYDSPFWLGGTPVPAVFDATHTLMSMTGVPDTWSYQTGDVGDDQSVTTITRVVPRFRLAPYSAQLTVYHRMQLGEPFVATGRTHDPVQLSAGRFDVLKSARWHRFSVAGAGAMEQSALKVVAVDGGME